MNINHKSVDSGSLTDSAPGTSPLADALADDIARALHKAWELKHAVVFKQQRSDELLHEFFEYARAQWPQNVVLTAEEEVTYAELELRSTQLANRLSQQGIASGAIIGICLPRSIKAYIALLAVLKTGGRCVELDAESPCKQIRSRAKKVKLTAIVTDSDLGLREDIVGVPLIYLDRRHNSAIAAPIDQDQRRVENELCYIIYTSRATERPQGVAVEPRKKSQKLRSLVSQQHGFGLQALALSNRSIEGFLGAV